MTLWFVRYDNMRVTSSAVETVHRLHSIKNMNNMNIVSIPNVHTTEEKIMTMTKFEDTIEVKFNVTSSYYEEQYGIDIIVPPDGGLPSIIEPPYLD